MITEEGEPSADDERQEDEDDHADNGRGDEGNGNFVIGVFDVFGFVFFESPEREDATDGEQTAENG